MGAKMQCTMGMTPAAIIVIPTGPPVLGESKPAATIMDNKPIVNIPPFGMCKSPANPTVASATAAASGVLTPMPCVPATPAPWVPGSTKVLINSKPALHDACKLICTWAGQISFVDAGELTIDIV